MLHRFEFHAMGCEMLAAADCESRPTLLEEVPSWFEEWEQVLSRFRYDSELTGLNRVHEQPVRVSRTLWEVFHAAVQAERLTEGLVTPTLLDALIEAGYDRPFDVLPHLAAPAPDSVIEVCAPLTAVTADPSARTLTLPPGMGLDFGGIAKGWCAHRAAQRLQSAAPALVNAGGDIAVSGPRADGSPWQIGVANPFQRQVELETLYVHRCGIATSGKDRRRWTRHNMLQHHIIDPLTGKPAETDLLTVTVIGPDVMQAEAAAKAAFILGSRAGREWIESHPQFAALFVLEDASLLYSRRMEEFL